MSLDLCELDKQGLVSNVLRLLWLKNHGQDPVRCARVREAVPCRVAAALLVIVLAVSYLYCSVPFQDSVLRSMMYVFAWLMALGWFMYAAAKTIIAFINQKQAARFSQCLEEAAFWWEYPPENFALWGRKNLFDKAEEVLRHEAQRLQEDEEQKKPRAEIEEQRRCFKKAHNVFRELGLAEKVWDPYFPKREGVEEQPLPAAEKPT